MAHHKINIRLSQMIEAGSFWKNPADHLMCDLTATFLVWSLRVTVEDSCTYLAVLITLDGQRIYLLHNIITKNCRAKWRILHLQNGENCRGYSDHQAMKNPLQT